MNRGIFTKLIAKSSSVEPYRFLFPLGAIFAVLGVIVWIKYAMFPDSVYPVQVHSHLMMGAFIFAFAAGFLMTAIPKMTASFPATASELILAHIFVLGNALLVFLGTAEHFYLMSAVSIFGLILFFARRVRHRQKPLPLFFPFVLMGLLSGFVGTLIGALPLFFNIPSEILFLGRKLYFEGMTLFLILGIGSRLIPVISGRGIVDQTGASVVIRNIILGLVLISGFILEASGKYLVGGILKSIAVTWVAYQSWGILAKSKTKSRLALGLRISGLMVLAGLYMSALQPAFAVHWMHLTYIAGFGLMTLTVASRVTLAHGSYDLAFEAKSPALWICGGLILAAALARVSAPFIASGYISHLLYAALLWILAVVIWGAVFIKRMIRKGEALPSC
ncbi:MAG: NnrS family protein [Pseudobdellovibrionaceae bacterium]